jgi:hypothetical protein
LGVLDLIPGVRDVPYATRSVILIVRVAAAVLVQCQVGGHQHVTRANDGRIQDAATKLPDEVVTGRGAVALSHLITFRRGPVPEQVW